jgi:hypothetical protein
MKEDDYEEITCRVPRLFLKLAHFYHLEPERLANALIYSFCAAPPRDLILSERVVVRARSAVLTDRV